MMVNHQSKMDNSKIDQQDTNNQQNIWSSILQQVQSSASNKLPSNKTILALGDNETGKTSLIAKMQGNEDPKKGSGLEYHYLLVRDEYRDEQTQLGVWVLDGDAVFKNLLKYALNEKNFQDTTIMLVASMANPWNIMDSLEQWANVLETHVKNLRMDQAHLNNHKKQLYKRYQEYISPGDEIEGLVVNSQIKSRKLTDSTQDKLDENDDEQIEDDVLTNNLGLDIVVVITKTDYMSTLEKEYDYKEESFDFIQQAIRKFCLKYGASLFYISAKINKNCDLLYKYLVHRIYGLPFKTPALVVEKDAVFIPAGWDNDKKIEILYENIQSFKPDDNYNEVIKKPLSRKVNQKVNEINCEEDQIFLLKIQSMLSQNVPSTPQNAIYKSFDKRPSSTVSPIDSANNKAGEGVLQNFFNNLLNRKTNPINPASPHTPPRSSIGNTSLSNTSLSNTSLGNTSLSNTSLSNVTRQDSNQNTPN